MNTRTIEEAINAVPPAPLGAFDPRRVPVSSVDTHLPAVAADRFGMQALRERFANPPVWTPETRRDTRAKPTDRAPAQAAVLVPIVMRDRPAVLLTQRTAHLKHHSGQVAFPGGRVDPEDANLSAAALREAWEEVGLSARYAEILGTLPTHTTITSFIVTPVVALVRPDFELAINSDEVAVAFEVPLAFLMNPANHRRHTLTDGLGSREWLSMPYQDGVHERFIWGATAGMLRNLYRFLLA
jgi:8-oxo-dGTP pyrophosphatase MutT (NUDIX family)